MTGNTPEAVRVHLAGSDVPLTERKDTRQQVLVPRTVILTSDEPAKQLALPNPEREFIGIVASTNPVVLSRSKGDAQAAGNLQSSITAPNGGLIPAGILIWIPETTSEIWASTGSYPTMVTVLEVTRRA